MPPGPEDLRQGGPLRRPRARRRVPEARRRPAVHRRRRRPRRRGSRRPFKRLLRHHVNLVLRAQVRRRVLRRRQDVLGARRRTRHQQRVRNPSGTAVQRSDPCVASRARGRGGPVHG